MKISVLKPNRCIYALESVTMYLLVSLISIHTAIAAATVDTNNDSWHLLRTCTLPDTVQVFYMY